VSIFRPGRLVRLLGLGFVLLASLAVAEQPAGYVFVGLETGAGGPAYFGFEGSLGRQWGAFEARLEGRLRLGNVVVADGVAWAGWRPLADLSLRAGYDAWFLDADATGRSPGGRADWRLPLGFGLAAAYDAASNVWGLGGGFENDYLRLRLWARNADWLAAAVATVGDVSLSGWYQAGYDSLTPKHYGLEAGWRRQAYSLAAGYTSYLGFTAAAGLDIEPFSLLASGHWYPERSGAMSARLIVDIGEGANVALVGSYAFLPIKTYSVSLEMQLPVILSTVAD